MIDAVKTIYLATGTLSHDSGFNVTSKIISVEEFADYASDINEFDF